MNMHSDNWVPHPPKGVTIFLSRTGPLLRYCDGALDIEDLNPEMKRQWRMSRWEIMVVGLRCLWAAIRP